MSSSEEIPTLEEMESLFVNNISLASIDGHLNRFNPIKIMKMERMEIRHSAILGWLLDPSETHGLDDVFLKAFLAGAMRSKPLKSSPTAIDISQVDLRDAIVRCEWQHIDIFIYSPSNEWAFIIENKFGSGLHSEQLRRYYEKVQSTYGQQSDKLVIQGILLSLINEDPDHEGYTAVNYENICELIIQVMDRESERLSHEVNIFMKHYLEILKEATGVVDDGQRKFEILARQLYRQHKKAIDYVVEHGGGSDFKLAAGSLFGEEREFPDRVTIGKYRYRFDEIYTDVVRFVPDQWYMALGEDTLDWKGCEEWGSTYPIASWLQVWSGKDGKEGQVALYAEVGPIEDHDVRSQLIGDIKAVAVDIDSKRIKFQKDAANEGKKISKFFKDNFVRVNDIQDSEELAAAMQKLLVKFQPEYDAIAKILPKYKDHGYVD